MELFIFDFTERDLLALPTKQGADPEGWVDWIASHPPLWGRLSLKSVHGNKIITDAILSRIVLISLYQVSPPPPSKMLDPPLQAYQNLNPDSIRSLFTEHISSHNLKENLKFEHTRSESKALNNSFTH